MIISLIVAADINNGIGSDNQLMWKLPADMEWFKKHTIGHHVLMGRKTYLSIPPKFRPLAERVNLVLSSQKLSIENVHVFQDMEDAVSFAREAREEKLCIIGGASVYKESLSIANQIVLSRIHHTFEEADVFFPEFRDQGWQRISKETRLRNERNIFDIDFEIWERVTN